MSRAILHALSICLTLGLLSAASVRVAHAEETATRAAKRHYERGQKLFALQKFDEALDQFQQAFDAKPIPDFLFNIGQCQRNLGDYEAAVFSFKRYLKLDPEAANREQVEELITELEEKLAADDAKKRGLRKKRSRDGDGDRPAPQADRPIYTKWWFWTGVVVVGAAGGVGIYAATSGGGGEGPPDTTLGKNIVFRR